MTKCTSWGIEKKIICCTGNADKDYMTWGHHKFIVLFRYLSPLFPFFLSFVLHFSIKINLFSILLENFQLYLKHVFHTAHAGTTAAYCTFWDWQKDLWQCIWQSHQVVFWLYVSCPFFLLDNVQNALKCM